MTEPKEFYRKLDSLLIKIGLVKSGTDFLFTIVKELEKTFGADLHIGRGLIYEKNADEFLLLSNLNKEEENIIEKKLNINSQAVQYVLNSKLYIFNNPSFTIGIIPGSIKEYVIPVAFTVHNQESRWIILFELKGGWVREEIEFCLNAVRTMLNYRLLSESIRNEYEQAYQIQKSLLPTASPVIAGYDIAGNSRQAELVGGDIFDYFQFDGEEFGFCIGDASGHGIPAALMARDAIIGLRMGLEKHMKMLHTLKKLNSVIYRSVYSTRFISLFYAEMEDNGNLFYVNAGHPSPILCYQDKITVLDSTGLVFGALEDIELHRSFVRMHRGSTLVAFSDGIIERQNKYGEEFSVEHLKSVILENNNKSAEDIMNAVFDAADEFGDKAKWEDDATVVVLKRLAE